MILLNYFSSYKDLNMAYYLQILTIIKRSIIITVYLISNAFNVKLLWDGGNQYGVHFLEKPTQISILVKYLNLFLIIGRFNCSIYF